MLKVDNINVFYGAIHAIKGISLEVNEGEIVTLIGANGAGKSTVLKTISGLLRTKTGGINFLGKDITSTLPHKIVERGLAHVPEGRRIFLQMTVQENLEMGAYTRPSGDIEAELEKVYVLFPRLLERRRQVAGTLSGGEQQMLAIGRALMARPRMLLLDEPGMGLAPLVVRDIFRHIVELRDRLGLTVLLVEQNAKSALKIADRGYVLENGRVILQGSAAELLANRDVQRAYLGREQEA